MLVRDGEGIFMGNGNPGKQTCNALCFYFFLGGEFFFVSGRVHSSKKSVRLHYYIDEVKDFYLSGLKSFFFFFLGIPFLNLRF